MIVSSHTFNCRSALAPSIGDGAARHGKSRLEVTKLDYRLHITFRHEAPHGSLCSRGNLQEGALGCGDRREKSSSSRSSFRRRKETMKPQAAIRINANELTRGAGPFD